MAVGEGTPVGRAIDIIGQKFGKWTVLERAGTSPTSSQPMWLCRCECGTERKLHGNSLKTGRTKSCGCSFVKKESTRWNSLYATTKTNARNKGVPFELSMDQFIELSRMNCHYCGVEPTIRKHGKLADIVANGIDRVDNDRGYTTDNVVPSCFQCNASKRNLHTADFVTWLKRIAQHQGIQGGVLSGNEIERMIERGNIVIDPLDRRFIGPNSVDLHMGDQLYRYNRKPGEPLDPRRLPPLMEIERTESGGWIIEPGTIYIGSTMEYTETHGLVPYLDGRSSLGRLGVFCHATAGRGDDGFTGRWTLEISAIEPVVLHPGGRYFQITYLTLRGERRPYVGRYQGDSGPVGSRIGDT